MIIYVICKKKKLVPNCRISFPTFRSMLFTDGRSFLYLVLNEVNVTTINKMTGMTLNIVPSKIKFPFKVVFVRIKTIRNANRLPDAVINFVTEGFWSAKYTTDIICTIKRMMKNVKTMDVSTYNSWFSMVLVFSIEFQLIKILLMWNTNKTILKMPINIT